MNNDNPKYWFQKEWNISLFEKVMNVIRSFSLTEKVLFVIFSLIFIFSSLSLLYKVNSSFLIEIPDNGGSLTEGIIGSPRFINPLLANSDIDRDLSTLIYSGLMKIGSNGELIPDIAESLNISPDGLVYSFKIRNDIVFHDGKKLTIDDVIFTIEKAQDAELKSPREANWVGVKVERVDDLNLNIILKQAYSPFIQSTTLGILPKHIWQNVTVEEFPFSKFNTNPIGSGPYKVESVSYTDSGLPKEYKLVSFNKYSFGKPYISNITIKSYGAEKDIVDAYKKGDIEAMHGVTPKVIKELKIDEKNITLSPLGRIFGLFFNQNISPVFANKEVRLALDTAIDKKSMIDEILSGYGQKINGAVPWEKSDEDNLTNEERMTKAKEILTKAGWKLDSSGVFEKKDKKGTTKLSFSISTGNVPELKEAAMILQRQWQLLGADIEVKIFEIGDLNQNIIKTRKYDSLLFGMVIGRDLDLYPFWHSSERNSPGLNISMYTNLKADKILENLRKTTDRQEQLNYLASFNREIKNDIPAVFLYSPQFIYIVPEKIKNINITELSNSSERFVDIRNWYIETSNVWKIFKK